MTGILKKNAGFYLLYGVILSDHVGSDVVQRVRQAPDPDRRDQLVLHVLRSGRSRPQRRGARGETQGVSFPDDPAAEARDGRKGKDGSSRSWLSAVTVVFNLVLFQLLREHSISSCRLRQDHPAERVGRDHARGRRLHADVQVQRQDADDGPRIRRGLLQPPRPDRGQEQRDREHIRVARDHRVGKADVDIHSTDIREPRSLSPDLPPCAQAQGRETLRLGEIACSG